MLYAISFFSNRARLSCYRGLLEAADALSEDMERMISGNDGGKVTQRQRAPRSWLGDKGIFCQFLAREAAFKCKQN
jgi:hypothetical protein